MMAPLIAHEREPLATMDTTRPPPLHLARLRACAHCGGKSWAYHTRQCCWLCRCYWHPEWRYRYQTPDSVPAAEQPQLPSASPMSICHRGTARPGNRGPVARPDAQEAWWANDP